MSAGLLTLIVVGLAGVGFLLGWQTSVRATRGDVRRLHSLPKYHGQTVFLFTAVPALLAMALWLLVQPLIMDARVLSGLGEQASNDEAAVALILADVRRVAGGLDALERAGMSADELAQLRAQTTDMRALLGTVGVALGSDVAPQVFDAAKRYRADKHMSAWAMSGLVAILALVGLTAALRRIHQEFRARNVSETFVRWLLIGASLIAVLTTLGIVLSLVTETVHFFQLYPARDFFLSFTWNPQFRGGSELGIWPLLWGTLYVSFVALLFAIPVGLFAAIYLAEYASARFRSWAKPAIEILAGIPTIVYGLFALITVGPLLRDYFAQPMGLGESSSSVMTAGLVMGIMLIPFVSSLSDDIINSVPQSMRDGSYGLGATRSETIRQVVLPAALPGVVGAILLAASRAIGETMIVVMAAGYTANLTDNPFDTISTVTVQIVALLTGDQDFASPHTLAAFALGLALFVTTFFLNYVALRVVKKYREAYE